MGKQSHATAEVLPTHSTEMFQRAVVRATELLKAGEVVALPTETVYGLAANAFNATAVKRLFEIKGRPPNNPIIVHVVSVAMARRCVAEWPALADTLAKTFWPGPLTLVLPRAAEIPDLVTAGGATVAVRWPSHPFIQAVIRACDFPLAAPSANLSGAISPTNAVHVLKNMGDRIRLIVDGGQAQVGIESTVLDLSVLPPRVLRPGMVCVESLRAAMGNVEFQISKCKTSDTESAPLRSPGQLPKHYSPRARLVIWSWRDDADLNSQLSTLKAQLSGVHVIAHMRIPSGAGLGRVSVIPHDAQAFARAIYAELHQCDEAGAELIVVEALPPGAEWQAIADRLKRAAA